MRRPAWRGILALALALAVFMGAQAATGGTPAARAFQEEGHVWEQAGHNTGTCCMTFYYTFPSGEYIGSVHAWQNGATGWNIINQTWPSDVLFVDGTSCWSTCGMGMEGDTNDSNTQTDGWSQMNWNPVSGVFIGVQYGYINDYYVNSYSSPKSQSVAAHELGHQVGLDHSGPFWDAQGHVICSLTVLMDPGTNTRFDACGISQPRQDDVNGVDAMY